MAGYLPSNFFPLSRGGHGYYYALGRQSSVSELIFVGNGV
jgi:hypothetical protein